MIRRTATAVTAEALAPYGTLISPPARPGERAFYTEWLGSTSPDATPRLHVNFVPHTALPCVISALERHPHAAQIFLPLAVSRYLIVVAPTLANGRPDVDKLEAFLAPGNRGVIYRANTWHAGATSLDSDGKFAVSMWRNDRDDDEFQALDEELQIEIAR